MTTIFSVVDASGQLPQREESRTPVQDFAHELAKQAAQPKPPAQGDAKATAHDGFDGQSAFEPIEPHIALNDMPQASTRIVMLQPLETAQPVTATPTEGTEAVLEARVFGWHAMAQAYLSELTVADDNLKQSDIWHADQADQVVSMEVMDEQQNANDVSLSAVAEQASMAPPVEGLLPQPSPAMDDATPVNVGESVVAGNAAPALWPERSLRFTRQRDGGSVAWLRDFRLSDSEASHLIRWVLSDANNKGIALSKIMLNGREAWTSPNFIKE
jgi:hypothetical protein